MYKHPLGLSAKYLSDLPIPSYTFSKLSHFQPSAYWRCFQANKKFWKNIIFRNNYKYQIILFGLDIDIEKDIEKDNILHSSLLKIACTDIIYMNNFYSNYTTIDVHVRNYGMLFRTMEITWLLRKFNNHSKARLLEYEIQQFSIQKFDSSICGWLLLTFQSDYFEFKACKIRHLILSMYPHWESLF